MNDYGWTYAFRSLDGPIVKIGYSADPIRRFRDLDALGRLQWLFAVPSNGKTWEKLIHGYWKKRGFWVPDCPGSTETFRLETDLREWIERVRSHPGVALSTDELDESYAFPGWLPGGSIPLPAIAEQQEFDLDDSRNLRRSRTAPGNSYQLATLSSSSDDWYTPSFYVELARRTMGGIDLDPASCPEANRTVRADYIYTIQDNGLTREWHGRIWLNPPYGGAQREFVRRLLTEVAAGRTEQAVLLLNANVTDTTWFQPLWGKPMCFTHHRIGFGAPQGQGTTSGTVGTVFVYFGDRVDTFREEFGICGALVEATPPRLTRDEFRVLRDRTLTVRK